MKGTALNLSASIAVLLDPAGHGEANEWLREATRYLLSDQPAHPR